MNDLHYCQVSTHRYMKTKNINGLFILRLVFYINVNEHLMTTTVQQ